MPAFKLFSDPDPVAVSSRRLSLFRRPRTLALPAAIIILIIAALALAACTAPPPQTREVAVTRQIEVTREVPVTQEVPVTVPVPVTVVIPTTPPAPIVREMPVTRIVPVTVTVAVPVTIETPVTRIVTATPPPDAPTTTAPAVTAQPAATSTPTPELMPTPAPTPTLALTPAPTTPVSASAPATPEPAYTAGAWQVYPRHYITDGALDGRPETPITWHAVNRAIQHETAGDPPVLTYQYQCRGRQSWSIDWNQRLYTRAGPTPRHRYDATPLLNYLDHDLEALVDYTSYLLTWIGEQTNLKDYQRDDVDDLWRLAKRQWSPAADTADDLIDLMRDRTHREMTIELAIAHQEPVDDDDADATNAAPRYLGPTIHTDDYNFIALSESRTQLYYGQAGSLKRHLREDGISARHNTDVVLYATVKTPYQHADVTAQWVITDLRKVEQHLTAICN